MRLFQRRGETNTPKSLEEIQSSLNYYASYNGPADTTVQVDRLRDQLDQLGLEAVYRTGHNTYAIEPATNTVYCNRCQCSHMPPDCD